MAEKKWIPTGQRGLKAPGAAGLLLAVLSIPVACASPAFMGYQIQDPPEGFLYDPSSTQADLVFPDREVMNHGAWWRMGDDDQYASISITRFRGAATVEDVEGARNWHEARVAQSGGGEVTQLQFRRIDGREAWGWEEKRRLEGELSAVASRTVVLYDTMAIALEFYSDMPEWMDPSRQEAVLASFAYGEPRILWGWFFVLLVLVAGLVGGFIRRVSRTADRPLADTGYKLPSIPSGEPGTAPAISPPPGGTGMPGPARPPSGPGPGGTDPGTSA